MRAADFRNHHVMLANQTKMGTNGMPPERFSAFEGNNTKKEQPSLPIPLSAWGFPDWRRMTQPVDFM